MRKQDVINKLESIIGFYNKDECPIVSDLIDNLEEYIVDIKQNNL